MCSCETAYETSCVRRNRAWHLYHEWYNNVTTPMTTPRVDFKMFFKDYPDVLKEIRAGKQIKIILYSRLRRETHRRRRAMNTLTQHCRFNAFGTMFYARTRVSPTFMFHKIVDFLG